MWSMRLWVHFFPFHYLMNNNKWSILLALLIYDIITSHIASFPHLSFYLSFHFNLFFSFFFQKCFISFLYFVLWIFPSELIISISLSISSFTFSSSSSSSFFFFFCTSFQLISSGWIFFAFSFMSSKSNLAVLIIKKWKDKQS